MTDAYDCQQLQSHDVKRCNGAMYEHTDRSMLTCKNGFRTQSPAFDMDLKLTPRRRLIKFLGVFWPGRTLIER